VQEGQQRVEHYEVAAYGTARAIAEQMERNDVVERKARLNQALLGNLLGS
jgi:ferritin-like metal-binding protein YciE